MYPNHHSTVPLNSSAIPRPNPSQDSANYDGGRHSVFPYMVPNRSNFNPFQIFHMEQVFNSECRPSRHVLEILSEKVSIPLKNVQIWFQNRRARARKKGEQLHSKNLKTIDSRNIYYTPQLQNNIHMSSSNGIPNQSVSMSDNFYSSTGYPVLPMSNYELQYRKHHELSNSKTNQFLPNGYSGSSLSDTSHPSSFQMSMSGTTSQPSMNYYHQTNMPTHSDIRYLKPFPSTEYPSTQPLTSPMPYHSKQSTPFTQDQLNSHFFTKLPAYNPYQALANQSKFADNSLKSELPSSSVVNTTSADPSQVNSLHPILSTIKPPYSQQQLISLFGTLPPSSQVDPSISHQNSDCPSIQPYDSPSGLPVDASSGPSPVPPAVSAS